jgi:hypothetical protein
MPPGHAARWIQARRLLARQRARLVVVGALLVYFAALEALGGHARWGRLGVPASSTRFFDLRSLIGAWDCTRRGVAVLPVDPCDPYGRPANFPRLWLVASPLGLGQGSAVALGIALAAVFLVSAVLVVPAGASAGTGLGYVLALCSPAVMLGVERGNPDLALFPLVLGAALVTTRTLGRQIVSGGLLLLAACLKLYPILAVGFLVRRWTRASLRVAAAVIGTFVVYVAATFRQLHEILTAVPQSSFLSYGVRRATQWFAALAERVTGGFAWYRPWDVVLVLAGVGLGWVVGRRLRSRLGELPADAAEQRDLDLFWAGACIYAGSYAVSLNFDYRLIFALLTVPQLLRWTRARQGLAFVTVPVLLATMWLDEWTRMPVLRPLLEWWTRATAVGSSPPLTLAVVAQFVLFSTFVAWLLATAPPALTRWRAKR